MILKETDYVKGTNELHLHCPKCDFEYTHLVNVETFKDSEGRLAVSLFFECEEGHSFQHCIRNHKGYTLVSNGIDKEIK